MNGRKSCTLEGGREGEKERGWGEGGKEGWGLGSREGGGGEEEEKLVYERNTEKAHTLCLFQYPICKLLKALGCLGNGIYYQTALETCYLINWTFTVR